MIVEFTGPSGAGKSTHIEQLASRLALHHIEVGIIGHDAKNIYGIPKVFANLSAQNWKTDIAALPWAFILMAEYPRYAFFVLRIIISLNSYRFSIFRSVIRKMGIFRFLSRQKFQDKVVLVDEGILHIGHNILLSPNSIASDNILKKFAQLTPISTFTIVLTAPHDVIVTRLLKRGDLSPRVKSITDLHSFVMNAILFYRYINKNLIGCSHGICFDTTQISKSDLSEAVLNRILQIASEKKETGLDPSIS